MGQKNVDKQISEELQLYRHSNSVIKFSKARNIKDNNNKNNIHRQIEEMGKHAKEEEEEE